LVDKATIFCLLKAAFFSQMLEKQAAEILENDVGIIGKFQF